MNIASLIAQPLNVTTGTVIYSAPLEVTHCLVVSADAVWTGTATGSIALQASNDGITYYDLVNTPVAITNAGSKFWDTTYLVGFKLMRIRLTSTSGAISSTFNMVAKG